jgi:acetylornithine deacetylase/succinyl-diaminopimelate desuccinylase-like protein
VTGIPVTGNPVTTPQAALEFTGSDEDYLRELAELVAVPSVSRDADQPTMLAAANWLAAQLAFAGGRVEQTAGHPVVRADWLGAPGAPTILVYGHYDVQPTGDLAEWLTPPFELAAAGDVARGRGVSDDKGPVYLVLKTARAFIEQDGRLPLNVKFLLEGEEEIGSPHLASYVAANAAALEADLVISADGAMWRPAEPSLSIGSKGLVSMDIIVEGAATDLHSGRYGGTVANPLHALSQILASLHDDDGRVAVAGFYDGVPPLTAERRREIAAVPFDEASYLRSLGLTEAHGEPGYSTLERLWERPTLEINGVSGGGKYTVIPHVAVASVSCRLVPGQDPDAVTGHVAAHVSAQQTPGVRARVRADDARVPAYTIAAGHPAIRAATAALQLVYPGQQVLLAKIGGTLPAADLFERKLGAKTLFFSFSTSDENLHAPNEFLRIARLREGMRATEALWRLLAAGPHRLGGTTDE